MGRCGQRSRLVPHAAFFSGVLPPCTSVAILRFAQPSGLLLCELRFRALMPQTQNVVPILPFSSISRRDMAGLTPVFGSGGAKFSARDETFARFGTQTPVSMGRVYVGATTRWSPPIPA